MRKWFAILSIVGIVFCLCGEAVAGEETVVASKYSDRNHLPSCKLADKLDADEIISFKSPKEAEAAGYMPCRKCHPLAVSTNLRTNKGETRS